MLNYDSRDEMRGQLQRSPGFTGALLLHKFGTNRMILAPPLQVRRPRAGKRPGSKSKVQPETEPGLGSFQHIFTGHFSLCLKIALDVCSPRSHVVSVWPVREVR